MGKHKYLNPITFEAEVFVKNFQDLLKSYKHVDTALLSSLEKVMNTIETFIDSNPGEILASNNIDLVKCGDIGHISRTYYCTLCKQSLGKSTDKVALHITENCAIFNQETCAVNEKSRNRRSNRNVSKKEGQSEEIKLTKKVLHLLTSNLTEFIGTHSKISNKLKCLPEYKEIENDLNSIITPLFPNQKVKIYKFGSRIAGIGSPDSDMDFYVDIGDTFNIFQNRADVETVQKLITVHKALRTKTRSWKNLIKIEHARVPILKVIHYRTGIDCDISFSSSVGVLSTQFFTYIYDLQPIAQLLCIFMKKWRNRLRLQNEVNTCSINFMVVFYLQMQKVLPAFVRFQEDLKDEKNVFVGPWLCTYNNLTLSELNIPKEEVNQANLLKFIKGFFTFYTNFNFNKYIICPYIGKPVKKKDFHSSMPLRYTDYVEKNPRWDISLDKLLIVQDCFQLNQNTTKNVTLKTLKILKCHMISSLNILNELKNLDKTTF